jgi:PAS domain S-box-containing protein
VPVLMVSLSAEDAALVERELSRAGLPADLRPCPSLEQLDQALAEPAPLVVLVGDGPQAPRVDALVACLRAREVDASVLALRDWRGVGEHDALDQGADEVVYRDRAESLGSAVARELRSRRQLRRLRRAEAARFTSEESIRKLIELAPDAMGVHRDGRYLWVNAKQAALFGLDSPAEMLGADVIASLHPDDRAQEADRLRRLEGGEPQGLHEVRILRHDGSVLQLEVASLLFEHHGRPTLLSISRDVTQRKLVEARMVQADRLSAVGKLAAGVAHEINNPLAYVIANLALLQTELPALLETVRGLHEELTPVGQARLAEAMARLGEAEDALGEAAEGAERVRVIVRDLKTFARPDDSGATRLDLRKVVETSINMAWNEIRHRARLVKEYGAVPAIQANESRVGHVVLTLLLHVAQSLPVGGRDQHCIRVSTSSDVQGRALLVIEDDGSAVAPEKLQRIFDPFCDARGTGGTGLGLSVVQSIVHELGGAIAARSEPGRGISFHVALPAAQAPMPAETEQQRAAGAAGRTRVLVVDDEPAVGNAVRRMLAEHDVTVVQSGREALRLLVRDASWHAIVCDLMMAELSGMDLFDELAQKLPGLERRMVFMTGGAFTPRAQEFLERVKNARLEKPFRRDELLALVASPETAHAA